MKICVRRETPRMNLGVRREMTRMGRNIREFAQNWSCVFSYNLCNFNYLVLRIQ